MGYDSSTGRQDGSTTDVGAAIPHTRGSKLASFGQNSDTLSKPSDRFSGTTPDPSGQLSNSADD